MAAKEFVSVNRCRLCGKSSLKEIISLGKHPLANSLLKTLEQPEKFYPLTLVHCGGCGLAQIKETVKPEIFFREYVWVTGTSRHATEFAPMFAAKLISRAPKLPVKSHFVVELASNDGTFLQPFIKKGFRVLGIDPAENIAEIARQNKVPTEAVFFGTREAKRIVKNHGRASIVFARNVLAHVADMNDFLKGARELLSDEGIIAIEPQDARHILEGVQYDSIYHEHLCYFTLGTLEQALKRNGLYVFDAVKSPISGGAIIVYASKKKRKPTVNLLVRRAYEKKYKINSTSRWCAFAASVLNHRTSFLRLLKQLKEKNVIVCGWGASARSSTLLNFCGINSKSISEISDMNPLKHGKFTAGTHIPILPPDSVMAKKPKAMVILGWNFAPEIIDLLKGKYHYRGICILPLPKKPKAIKI